MKEQLVEYIKACQKAVDETDSNVCENYVAIEMGKMSIHLNLSGQGELIKELIQEFGDKYSVVKYLGSIVE